MALPMMEVGKSGMLAQEFNLRNISNSLANVNTTGFKAQRTEFQDQYYQTLTSAGATTSTGNTVPEGTQGGTGVIVAGTSTDFKPGNVIPTNSPLDIAITGDGWFTIEKDGQQYLTRDGNFRQATDGRIVNKDGYPLTPNITVPQGAHSVSVSASGSVSATLPGQTNAQEIGRIQLAMVANNGGLMRVGKNLWITSEASGAIQEVNPGENGSGALQGNALEASNASIVDLMVEMITAQRAFEANSKVVQTGDQILDIINNLKR